MLVPGPRYHLVIVRYIDALGGISSVLFVFVGLQVSHHLRQIHVRCLLLVLLLLFMALLHHRKQVLVFDGHLDLGIHIELLTTYVVCDLFCAMIP